MFDTALPIHIASRVHAEANNTSYSDEEILNTLDKRPLTIDDLKLLLDENSMNRFNVLRENEDIVIKLVGNLEFFVPKANEQRKLKK